MLLCIQNIIDWLGNKQIYGHANYSPGEPILRSVQWLSDKETEQGILYVVPSYQQKNGTIITYEDGILYYEDDEPEEIFNELLKAFYFYASWERELLETSFEADALYKLLDIANKVFETKLVIVNESNHVLAHTSNCSPETLFSATHLKKEQIVICETGFDSQYIPFGLPILKSVLWYTDYPIGEIIIYEYAKPLNSGILHMLNVFTNIVISHIALNPEKHIGAAYLEKEFIKMLQDEFVDSDNFLIALGNLDWNADDCYQVITLVHTFAGSDQSSLLPILKSRINHCYIIFFQDQLSILLNQTKNKDALNQTLNFLNTEKERVFAGISFPFCRIQKLNEYYKQSVFALDAAIKEKSTFVFIQQIIPKVLSMLIEEESTLSFMVHPDILKLKNYDSEHQTDYTKTFKAFVLSGCNYALSAQKLALHQNTLRYRIKKIEDLISGNLYELQYRENIIYSLLVDHT